MLDAGLREVAQVDNPALQEGAARLNGEASDLTTSQIKRPQGLNLFQVVANEALLTLRSFRDGLKEDLEHPLCREFANGQPEDGPRAASKLLDSFCEAVIWREGVLSLIERGNPQLALTIKGTGAVKSKYAENILDGISDDVAQLKEFKQRALHALSSLHESMTIRPASDVGQSETFKVASDHLMQGALGLVSAVQQLAPQEIGLVNVSEPQSVAAVETVVEPDVVQHTEPLAETTAAPLVAPTAVSSEPEVTEAPAPVVEIDSRVAALTLVKQPYSLYAQNTLDAQQEPVAPEEYLRIRIEALGKFDDADTLSEIVRGLDTARDKWHAVKVMDQAFKRLSALGREEIVSNFTSSEDSLTAYWAAHNLKRESLLPLLKDGAPPTAVVEGIYCFDVLTLEDRKSLALQAKSAAVRCEALSSIREPAARLETLVELTKSSNSEIRKEMGSWRKLTSDLNGLQFTIDLIRSPGHAIHIAPRVILSRIVEAIPFRARS